MSFIKQDFLNEKQIDRMDLIKEDFSVTYGNDDIQSELFETFNTKDAVVWVDPLDGTRDFVKGNLPAVTVLIGVAIRNKSRIGIIHTPYSVSNPNAGKTIFGTGE